MDRPRIGFVGVGGMGQCAHLRNYAALASCEVVALAELRPELGRKVAARYGIPQVFGSAAEMLDAVALDAIVASQPFTRHGVLVPELARAGVPIFTEKPLASSIEAGQRILEALDRSGIWHMVGYHKRSDPAAMYARAEIERLRSTGELGALRYVRIVMPAGDWVAGGFTDLLGSDDPCPPLETDPPAADMDEETAAQYNAFVNYYIHQVNLMRHLLGEPYTVAYADPSGVLLAATSASGVCGTIEMSPYTTTIDWHESALVAFERGYVRLDLPAPLASNRPGRVEVFKDPGGGVTPVTIVPTLPWVHAMRQQAENFVRAVRGEIPPMCEAHEAMEDLQAARAYIRLLMGR